jgi:hypothetical protein
VSQKIVQTLTARLPANGPSVGDVVILEYTDVVHFTVDGRPETLNGDKRYKLATGEPVNQDASGFTLARNRERLLLR